MAIFEQHSADHADALMRPAQSWKNKIGRALWNVTWTLLCRSTPPGMHRWRCWMLRLFGAKIGKNNFIYPSARVWAPWLLETGDVVTLAQKTFVYNVGGVTIGHHAIVSEDAFVCGATHDYQSPDFELVSRPVTIAPYAWICARAIILPGVECGEGAVLGAGAVASRDLDPWTVYAGNPACKRGVRNRGDRVGLAKENGEQTT